MWTMMIMRWWYVWQIGSWIATNWQSAIVSVSPYSRVVWLAQEPSLLSEMYRLGWDMRRAPQNKNVMKWIIRWCMTSHQVAFISSLKIHYLMHWLPTSIYQFWKLIIRRSLISSGIKACVRNHIHILLRYDYSFMGINSGLAKSLLMLGDGWVTAPNIIIYL